MMETNSLPDTSLLEAHQRSKLKMKDSLKAIFAELSVGEQCSVVFLVLNRQDLATDGYKLCQYSSSGKDISERLWLSCNDVSALVSSLYHICRYDLLEQHLGLCVAHSMEQVCVSLEGIAADRLALYRVFAAIPQHSADWLLANYLPRWLSPEPGRLLEESFCRTLATHDSPGYVSLLTELHAALCTSRLDPSLATALRPHLPETGPSQVADAVYPLPRSYPHGLCVIINVNSIIKPVEPEQEFNFPTRRGSDIDTMRLEGTFRLFGFEIMHMRDPDYQTIKTFFEYLNSNCDARLATMACLAVVFMTHGDAEDHLYLHDRRPLSLYDLRSLCFSPFFVNKPRLFFVQACRGDRILTPIFVQHDGVQAVNRESDCLVCCATVRGYSAMRSKSSGSWFISDLCSALQQLGHEQPLRKVLLQARLSLNARVDTLGCHIVTQTSEDVATLVREVQLVRAAPPHFSYGCLLLMLVNLLEELIEEAVDQYCAQLHPNSPQWRAALEDLCQQDEYPSVAGVGY